MNRMLCSFCVLLCVFNPVVLCDDELGEQPVSTQELATITLWSTDDVLSGDIASVDDQGIRIRVGDAVIPIQIPWYDIRDVHSDSSQAARYDDFKKKARKAHARLVRGDYPGASSVYEFIKGDYYWERGEQTADICFGLLLCRLDAGNRVGAIRPLLSWYGSLVDEFSTRVMHLSPYQSAAYNEEYGLCTVLPPVFSDHDRAQELGKVPEGEGYTVRQLVLGHGYELAYHSNIHRTPEARDRLREISSFTLGRDQHDAGLDLFEDMVIAQAHPDAEKREAARNRLARRVRSQPKTWIEVWARLGIGVSLLAESEVDPRERGAIELIHILVRLKHVDPGLTRLAAELVKDYFVETDRPKWGAKLMHDSLHDFEPRPVRMLSEEHSAHE